MSGLFNKKHLEPYRKRLRNNSTSAEAVFWIKLKNKQLDGRRFRRQFSVGNYILDFYCPSEKIAVELDGESHFTLSGMEQDFVRDEYLNTLNIKVLRFENRLVFENPDYILNEIRKLFAKPL